MIFTRAESDLEGLKKIETMKTDSEPCIVPGVINRNKQEPGNYYRGEW